MNEYLRVLTQAEGVTSVLYSKTNSELNAAHCQVDRERAWTICIVYNPKRNQKVDAAMRAQNQAGVNLAIPENCRIALE